MSSSLRLPSLRQHGASDPPNVKLWWDGHVQMPPAWTILDPPVSLRQTFNVVSPSTSPVQSFQVLSPLTSKYYCKCDNVAVYTDGQSGTFVFWWIANVPVLLALSICFWWKSKHRWQSGVVLPDRWVHAPPSSVNTTEWFLFIKASEMNGVTGQE